MGLAVTLPGFNIGVPLVRNLSCVLHQTNITFFIKHRGFCE